VFHGENKNNLMVQDLTHVEMFCFALMMLGLLWMGMYPQSMLSMSEPTLRSLGVLYFQ